MYDTIYLWLASDRIGTPDYLTEVPSLLTEVGDWSKPDGTVIIKGMMKNLTVSIFPSGISIRGSLAKFYLGDNFNTLTRNDAQKALEMLTEACKLPVMEAKVTRIDIAQNFKMKYPVTTYFQGLSNCSRFKRNIWGNSLYFTNGRKTIVIYNKLEEGKAKKVPLAKELEGINFLRYELRLTSHLAKQVNMKEVIAKDLFDEQFYIKLIRKWGQEYEKIDKTDFAGVNPKAVKSPKNFTELIALCHIKEKGLDSIFQIIESMKAQKVFDKPEYYSIVKRKMRTLCKSGLLKEGETIIEELDKKVKRTLTHYR